MGNICSKSASDSETHGMEDTCPRGESSSVEHMDSQLTQNQIVRLATAISADNMAAIAEGYMDISPEIVKNTRRDANNSETFIRDIIRHWAYRNPENQLQVSRPKKLLFYHSICQAFPKRLNIMTILVCRAYAMMCPAPSIHFAGLWGIAPFYPFTIT